MTPDEIQVYDTYPQWFTHLVTATDALCSLPLDGMLNATSRMTLTNVYIGEHGTEPADPIAIARQKRLIEMARTFRDAALAGRVEQQ